jgi:hypothetical protein
MTADSVKMTADSVKVDPVDHLRHSFNTCDTPSTLATLLQRPPLNTLNLSSRLRWKLCLWPKAQAAHAC